MLYLLENWKYQKKWKGLVLSFDTTPATQVVFKVCVCACVVWTKKKIYLPWEYHTYEIIFKVVFDPTIITLFEPDFSIF